MGAVLLAKKTGQPILPFTITPERFWSVSKSWDCLRIPKFFTRARVEIAAPIFVPPDADETALTGSFPVNPSGGVLSSNPIGASGLLRFAEAANQVRGAAGEHQVSDANVALAMAYGANSQYFSTWVVANSLHPFG